MPRWVPIQNASGSSGIKILNAARYARLAATARTVLVGRGWRGITIGDASQVRKASMIWYPADRVVLGRRLAAQFGIRTLIARDFEAAYQQFDLLLSPTSPTTAFALGAKTADPLTMYLNDICTIPTNLVGHAAVSVPFGVGDDGLPVGVQVLAPALGEPTMFRAAAVLEEAAR
jgi:aspartyl-tRNA(Asn)/glutamyl-tRNA(Gln) amidotransferase subunit A